MKKTFYTLCIAAVFVSCNLDEFPLDKRKYPLIPTLWMIFEDSTFAFRSGDKHRSRRIYGK